MKLMTHLEAVCGEKTAEIMGVDTLALTTTETTPTNGEPLALAGTYGLTITLERLLLLKQKIKQ